MLKHSDYYLFDIHHPSFSWDAVINQLKTDGFVAIRGLFPGELIVDVYSRVNEVMKNPSLGGSYGYYRKDYAKKLFDPLLLSGNVVDLLVNPMVIDFAEQYLNGEVVLAECNIKDDLGVNQVYFPMHSDFAPGWQVQGSGGVVLSQEDLRSPVAVGAMLYLHDTTDGAFCFAKGTHLVDKDCGPDLSSYSDDVQRDVMAKMVRVEGQAGDLVLFDDRGFHGPEQPVPKRRTVLIFDYYKLKTFGEKTKVAIPAILSDLGHLSTKQLRVLGLGIKALVPYKDNHVRSYDQSPYYRKLSRIFERKFVCRKYFMKMKNRLRAVKCKILR